MICEFFYMKNFEKDKSHLGGNNIVCFLYPQEKFLE